MSVVGRGLAGLLLAALAGACMPVEGAGPQAGATPQPEAGADRQLVLAHRQLGAGLEAAGDIEGAVDEYIAALSFGDWRNIPESGGIDGTPLGDLARICARVEPPEAVVRACGRVVGSFSFAPGRLTVALINRGDANFTLGEFQRAGADYDSALQIETSNPRALLGRGRVRAQEGNHLDAVADFRRAIASDPGQPGPLHARALSLTALGDPEAAIADFDEVLATPQGIAAYPDAYRQRADLHCATGQADAAAIGWQVWLAQAPDGGREVQEMLAERGFLDQPVSEGFSPAALAGLRAWTQAGCPEAG